VIAKIDRDDVYGLLRRQSRQVWVSASLLSAVFALGIAWLWRRREAHSLRETLAGERQRQRLQAQLVQSQKLTSIGTLAGGMAHEINNPITGVMNYAQLIRDEVAGTNELVDTFASGILDESERVAVLVRNLLRFSKPESTEHLPAAPSEIITDTLSMTRTAFKHDGIEVETEVPEGLPMVRCRREQIQQVLLNILSNARDALNELGTDRPSGKRIRITAGVHGRPDRRTVRISVEDNGPGIPEEVCERVFDPFYTTKRPDRGTGLGLSVSYGIVRDHDGALSVHSNPGEGARFDIELPVDETPTQANVTPASGT
jgi:signal transduction histidine kinase